MRAPVTYEHVARRHAAHALRLTPYALRLTPYALPTHCMRSQKSIPLKALVSHDMQEIKHVRSGWEKKDGSRGRASESLAAERALSCAASESRERAERARSLLSRAHATRSSMPCIRESRAQSREREREVGREVCREVCIEVCIEVWRGRTCGGDRQRD